MAGQSDCHNLYETFDDACDSIEEEIKAYSLHSYEDFQKNRPNRKEKLKVLEESDIVTYWVLGDELCIAKMKIVPKKKYPVYYCKAVSTDGRVIVSQEFSSFDEAFTLLEQTIRNYETYKYEHWKPSLTREQLKEELENNLSVEYARFDHDETDTIVYDLKKKMV